eukprot:TRINITY_DN15535_c0_g1_i2.p1 TRINITY_DN15535_c0_g1~~TRINITY_DN15535_c0_g1_i2.p1  ORF type:complete len:468 (-),score=22.47 TRINITY_DN15535_c0_g1_i2:19-1422(-)
MRLPSVAAIICCIQETTGARVKNDLSHQASHSMTHEHGIHQGIDVASRLPTGACADTSVRPFTQSTKELGSGALGNVFVASACGTQTFNKVVKHLRYDNDSSIADIESEIEPMRLALPFNANLDAVYLDVGQKRVSILNTLYLGGDLSDYFFRYCRHFNEKGLYTHDLMAVGRQTAYALWELHRSHFLHGDVKPENVFIARKREWRLAKVVLSDFGFAQRCGPTSCSRRFTRATKSYMAPNFAELTPYGYEIDWWAHSVMMAFLRKGGLPFFLKTRNMKNSSEIIARGPRIVDVDAPVTDAQSPLVLYLSNMLNRTYYLDGLANDHSRELMQQDEPFLHPILRQSVWHGLSDRDEINEYWARYCRENAIDPSRCDKGGRREPISSSLCPACSCRDWCDIPHVRLEKVCGDSTCDAKEFPEFSNDAKCCECLKQDSALNKEVCWDTRRFTRHLKRITPLRILMSSLVS